MTSCDSLSHPQLPGKSLWGIPVFSGKNKQGAVMTTLGQEYPNVSFFFLISMDSTPKNPVIPEVDQWFSEVGYLADALDFQGANICIQLLPQFSQTLAENVFAEGSALDSSLNPGNPSHWTRHIPKYFFKDFQGILQKVRLSFVCLYLRDMSTCR